jgi:hypothetical protein
MQSRRILPHTVRRYATAASFTSWASPSRRIPRKLQRPWGPAVSDQQASRHPRPARRG